MQTQLQRKKKQLEESLKHKMIKEKKKRNTIFTLNTIHFKLVCIKRSFPSYCIIKMDKF